jgi:sigma-E factor negative regulatory protein RseB
MRRVVSLFVPVLLVGLLALGGQARADAGALEWLNRAADAARQLNYSGVYVYHHGEHVEVLRVSHRADASGEQEKVEVLDGMPRHFLRINRDVYCHLSDGKSVRLERDAARRFFPALLPEEPAKLMNHYSASLGGIERVAGRASQVVMLKPRDGYRHGFNLWLDRHTALPLKARIVNDSGAVVSMFVFSEIQIGRPPDPQIFRNDLAGKRILNASLGQQADVAWEVAPPPGFVRVQEAVRPFPGKRSPVTHLVFSDGLSVLSLFIEPVDGQPQSLQGLSAEGAIGVYSRQNGGFKITAMGEVPSAALIAAGNSVRKR